MVASPGVFDRWNEVVPAGTLIGVSGRELQYVDLVDPKKIHQIDLEAGTEVVVPGTISGSITCEGLVSLGNTQTFEDFRTDYHRRATGQLPNQEA